MSQQTKDTLQDLIVRVRDALADVKGAETAYYQGLMPWETLNGYLTKYRALDRLLRAKSKQAAREHEKILKAKYAKA